MNDNNNLDQSILKRYKWGSLVGRISVNNSLLVNLISVFILIVGVVTLLTLRREAFPNVSMDIVTISTVYPGASPEEVEKLVSIPLEDEIKEVDDIGESTSVSLEGVSMIVLEIDPDATDKGEVVDEIRRAVDRVNDLPADLPEDPAVTEIKTKNTPVIEVSLTGVLSETRLRELARDLENELEEIPNVSKIVRSGYRDREFWVEVDPVKAAKRYIALNEVVEALRQQNVRIPGGDLELAEKTYLLRTSGEFETTEEVEQVIIRANTQGNWVRVRDIAHVRDTFEDEDLILKTMGKRAVNLVVIKKQVGDTISIVEQIEPMIAAFQEKHGDDLQIELVNDISYYIKRRLGVLVNNGSYGIAMVVLALFVFLSPMVAILTALGIPICFMTAFIIMWFYGISINLITMFGLILVLGMVVDDAIVIAENCFRYLEKGFKPKEAAIYGTAEVTKPVTATIITTIIAFSPLFFMSGLIGKFIRNVPLVVTIALLASLFEALIILPSHIAEFTGWLARKKRPRDRTKSGVYKVLLKFYDFWLQRALHFRYAAIGLLVLAGFGTYQLYKAKIPFILFPRKGIEIFFVRAEAPIGTSLQETNRTIRPIEDLVATLPDHELDAFVTTVGLIQNDPNDPTARRGHHYAQTIVYLTPESKRERTAEQIIEDLRGRLGPVEGLSRVYFERVRPGPPVGKPVVIRFSGDEYKDLLAVAGKAEKKLKSLDGVSDVRNDYEVGQREIVVSVDEEAATRSFLTVGRVAAAVRTAFEGEVATSIRRTDEEIDVRVRYPEPVRKKKDSLKDLLIMNTRGNLVPLGRIAQFKQEQGIAFYRHLDHDRAITVSADIDEDLTTSLEVNNLMEDFSRGLLKGRIGMKVSFGGEQEKTQESLGDLKIAFLMAALLVFMILAATFRSLVQPLVILTAIPFGLIGVVVAFYLHAWPLTFLALLGVVGLTGVVVNDSIILVDFINQARKQGRPRRESIIEAGHTRLRPVILTTVTTVVGLLPVAYGIGGGDPFLMPMALSVSYGLMFATTLTLIAIPCIYAIIDDIVSGFFRLFPRLKRDYRPKDEVGPAARLLTER